jgi:uncharacterized protein (TIGR03435 family)
MRTDQRELLAIGILDRPSRIRQRIESILRQHPRLPSRRYAACSVIGLLACLVASSSAPRWIAFAQTHSSPAFAVATVKANTSGDPNFSVRIVPGGRLHAVNATLRSLITTAYEIPDSRLTGGPSWINSARFDVDAKGTTQASDQILAELKQLLSDRFHLSIRTELKEESVYAIVIGHGGPRLQPPRAACFDPTPGLPPPASAPGEPPPRPCGGFNHSTGQILGAAVPMRHFAMYLARILGKPVINQTGLDGPFDIVLNWTPAPGEWDVRYLPPGAAPPSPDGPSIFTAMQDQLGLRLESTRGQIETFVINHAEKPDAN